MQGGTFSISSLGGIGGTAFTPIINAPEVAILGVSRSAMRPVWDGKAFVPRLMLPLSLSYDHRVIDGASAARFTSYLASVLSDIRRSLVRQRCIAQQRFTLQRNALLQKKRSAPWLIRSK